MHLRGSLNLPLAALAINSIGWTGGGHRPEVSTPDFSSAYRIFTVLNNRGLNLTNSDILKAELIGTITPSAQAAYTRKWEDTEDALGREGFQELFAHVRMIYRKVKLAETVLQEYKKYVVPAGTDAAKFIDDVVIPYSDAYDIIKTAAYQSTSGADAVNALLRWLNQIDNSDWVPPAILYVSRNMQDTAGLVKFLSDLERLAAGQMILRYNINERINRYARVLTAVEQGADLYATDSPLQLTDAEKQDVLKILDGDLYLETKIRLYVLLRLDSELSKGLSFHGETARRSPKLSKWAVHRQWPCSTILDEKIVGCPPERRSICRRFSRA